MLVMLGMLPGLRSWVPGLVIHVLKAKQAKKNTDLEKKKTRRKTPLPQKGKKNQGPVLTHLTHLKQPYRRC